MGELTWADKFRHLCLFSALGLILPLDVLIWTALVIEGTQLEKDWRENEFCFLFLKRYDWPDTILDLAADGLGIFIGLKLASILGFTWQLF